MTLCGQVVEEKNELQKKFEQLDLAIKATRQHTPEVGGSISGCGLMMGMIT